MALYFAFLLIDTAFCEYDTEYVNNDLDQQKSYTFSQLNNDCQEDEEQN